MEKALKMGKVSATGGFQLFGGVAASIIVKSLATILLVRLMSPPQYGLYVVALIPHLMIGLFRDWGVGQAMTKYIAQYRSEKGDKDIRDIVVAGLTFEIATGMVLAMLSYFMASLIASTIFRRPETAFLISITSFAVFAGSLLTVSQSTFVGYERMNLYSLTMVCEALVKISVAPLLVLLGYGAFGAVLGHTVALFSAGIMSVVLLYFVVFRKSNIKGSGRRAISKNLKSLLQYGVPLSISLIIVEFMIQFYSLVMAFYVTDLMIGNYQAANNIALTLTLFTFPISTVLLPAFAKINPQKERQLLKNVFASAAKYTALLIVPATMAMIVLSRPLVNTLFGEKWVYAPFFLALSLLANLFAVFGFPLSQGGFLAGLGETNLLMKTGVLSLLFGLPLAFLLIPPLGIVGVIIGLTLAVLPKLVVGIVYMWKRYEVTVDWSSSARILASSTIAAAATYFSLNFLNTVEWLKLIAGGIIFLTAYLTVAPCLGAIVQSDIGNLRIMLSGLGFFSKLANLPLDIIEKVAALLRARRFLEGEKSEE